MMQTQCYVMSYVMSLSADADDYSASLLHTCSENMLLATMKDDVTTTMDSSVTDSEYNQLHLNQNHLRTSTLTSQHPAHHQVHQKKKTLAMSRKQNMSTVSYRLHIMT